MLPFALSMVMLATSATSFPIQGRSIVIKSAPTDAAPFQQQVGFVLGGQFVRLADGQEGVAYLVQMGSSRATVARPGDPLAQPALVVKVVQPAGRSRPLGWGTPVVVDYLGDGRGRVVRSRIPNENDGLSPALWWQQELPAGNK